MGVSVGSSIYNAPSIYESGAGGGGGGGEGLPVGEIVEFPSGYTPLEKITFEGLSNECINIPYSGYRANNNTTENTVVISLKVNDITKPCQFIRFNPVTPNNGIYFNGYHYCLMYSNSYFRNVFVDQTNELKEKSNVSYKYNRVSLNNHIENKPELTTINTVTNVIIGNLPGNVNVTYMDIYAVKIYDPNDNMIFFGVPAFDEANQIDGLLDLITNDFFPHFWQT